LNLENKVINIGVVAEIAEALGEIKDDIVFVGGAVVSLYTDDPAADEIRPTKDIDMTLQIVNLHHWQLINEKLALLGFNPDPYGQSICSYKYKDIPVDIMATEDGPLGPANRWYKLGFENLWTARAKQQEIKILSAPCYLATKFEAFKNRGSDYRTSHDIEDIIYIIDNRINIVEDIALENELISSFIKERLNDIVKKGLLKEVLMAHIHPIMSDQRIPIVEEKITKILNL
jgi:hypothetical protein